MFHYYVAKGAFTNLAQLTSYIALLQQDNDKLRYLFRFKDPKKKQTPGK